MDFRFPLRARKDLLHDTKSSSNREMIANKGTNSKKTRKSFHSNLPIQQTGAYSTIYAKKFRTLQTN